MIALIDADILVFRCGFAAERNRWFLNILTGPKKGLQSEFEFKKDANQALDDALPGVYSRAEGEDYQLYSERKLEPLSHALHNVNVAVKKICENLAINDFDVRMFLSGDTNFRYDVAKTKPYKGTRKKAHRPAHEDEIRAHMISTWDTNVAQGIEADDALGIAQCKGNEETVIVSIDKDLDMIPGYHYNPTHDLTYEISEADGVSCFANQLLTGDSTDNIPGLSGVGPVAAERALGGLETDELLEACARMYASKSGREDWFEYLTEQATLLWILREPLDVPVIPFMFEGLDNLGGDDGGTIQTDLFG